MKTNRAAIGARINVTVENEGRGTRSIHRTVGSGGSFGASPLEQHIGLGKSARIVDLEIWWPAQQHAPALRGRREEPGRGNHRARRGLHEARAASVRLGGARRAE